MSNSLNGWFGQSVCPVSAHQLGDERLLHALRLDPSPEDDGQSLPGHAHRADVVDADAAGGVDKKKDVMQSKPLK